MLTFTPIFSELPPPPTTTRTVAITDDSGKTVFEQKNVEAPATWSELAVKVVASKYFYGKPDSPERERSVYAVVKRVVDTIAQWGVEDGYFDKENGDVFCKELYGAIIHQIGVFNSPVWFNVGLWQHYRAGGQSQGNWRYNPDVPGKAERCPTQYENPQCSACFIQKVDDNMESLMNLAYQEAMLFKFGSGTGTNLSSIRSSRESLSGGGKPSGPLSFLRIYDQVANVVKSGGKTRRAAKMNILDDWHPDIEEFIEAKMKEEKKAHALIEAGYDPSFNGDAYGSVAYQNENLSVRVTDEFMKIATGTGEWWTHTVQTGERLEQKDAKALLHKIAEGTWFCGDPGLQFVDTINKWHTCSGTEPIHATNPCAEYVFLDETACNLASLNLMKFKIRGSFDLERFEHAVRLFITAQEILVDRASYPTASITVNSHIFRTLGLGYANLGALIMSCGLSYDSETARNFAAGITALMTAAAYDQSSDIASFKGPFEGLHESSCYHVPKQMTVRPNNVDSMKKVLNQHLHAAIKLTESIKCGACTVSLKRATKLFEQSLSKGTWRNAQVTVVAPTGTIAFMMDCDTTGIEPDISLVKYKLLAGGGNLKYANKTVPMALEVLGYTKDQIKQITDHIEMFDTIEDVGDHASGLKIEHLPIFDCAFKPKRGKRSINYKAHIKIMAAVQPFLSGAISKTINMPNDSTAEEIVNAYIMAWKMGLKCVAIYRDGSKRSQPLTTGKKDQQTPDVVALNEELEERKAEIQELWQRIDKMGGPVRKRLSDTRNAVTHKFSISGIEGYLTVGMFDDGSPGELFITVSKEGSTIGGLMDSVGTLTSIALQYGVPLETLVSKFSFTRFEPQGFTSHPKIRQTSSIIDYVFRWLGHEFLEPEKEPVVPPTGLQATLTPAIPVMGLKTKQVELAKRNAEFQIDAPICGICGHVTVRSGSCYRCDNCGNSQGCS